MGIIELIVKLCEEHYSYFADYSGLVRVTGTALIEPLSGGSYKKHSIEEYKKHHIDGILKKEKGDFFYHVENISLYESDFEHLDKVFEIVKTSMGSSFSIKEKIERIENIMNAINPPRWCDTPLSLNIKEIKGYAKDVPTDDPFHPDRKRSGRGVHAEWESGLGIYSLDFTEAVGTSIPW